MSIANSTADLAGTITTTTARKSTPIILSQTITNLLIRNLEVVVPHASTVSVALDFPAGVTELLLMHVNSPQAVKMTLTSADGMTAGPATFGLKGTWWATLTPGDGIIAISFTNADPTNDAVIDLMTGSKASPADDDPSFWTTG